MNSQPIWLIGTLASHARGKVLTGVTEAIAANTLPDEHGLCLAFGSDFQDANETLQEEWTAWAEPAGRTLLLIPPFKLDESKIPVSWRVYRPQKVDATGADQLARLLANEVRFELSGPLQVASEVGGQWKNGGLHTAYFRRHPHSGLFAMTCLPLWSLTVLDHRDAIRNWLNAIGSVAGEPAPLVEAEQESKEFRPSRDHFALLLHLCERDYESRDEALARLADSLVLSIPDDAARLRLEELEAAGLALNGKLTEAGQATLLASPYAVYAAAMRGNQQ